MLKLRTFVVVGISALLAGICQAGEFETTKMVSGLRFAEGQMNGAIAGAPSPVTAPEGKSTLMRSLGLTKPTPTEQGQQTIPSPQIGDKPAAESQAWKRHLGLSLIGGVLGVGVAAVIGAPTLGAVAVLAGTGAALF
ncbi:MAG: hypothetical protein PHI34_15305, partial [Acidobacteriota bacterium]|nr:hypothetical protein [Acidobacteriota bacterium]